MLLVTIFTITKERIIMARPIIALVKVFCPFSARSSLPAELKYQKPPKIINKTATVADRERIILITYNNNVLA